MNAGRIAWSIVGLLSLSVVAWGGPVLIGGTENGVIYDVDPTTGAASNPLDTGLQNLSGAGWHLYEVRSQDTLSAGVTFFV